MEYLLTAILIGCSALFSGLTLGYFSLNPSTLRRRAKLGDEEAQSILPIRQQGNLLLTTLLLGNVAVNTILSVYLGSIASGVVASLLATTLIFLFGEIIPQAVISRHALWFGSRLAPVVRGLVVLFYPIAFPIARALDYFLGEEMPTLYSRHELMEIVSELEDAKQGVIDKDEERIVHGALMFSHTTVREVMTNKDTVVRFAATERVSDSLLASLAENSYSRYLIYNGHKDNIIGILYAKDLIHADHDTLLIDTVAYNENFLTVKSGATLDTVLAQMLKRRQHLGVVTSKNGQFLGVISLEDIIEEIIQTEIEDETDGEETEN